jgi:hypothetical protein
VVRGFYEQGPDGPELGHPSFKVRKLEDLDAALGDKLANVLPAVELDGSAPFDSWPPAVTESGAPLAIGGEAISTRPCSIYVEKYTRNTQGGAEMM